jgi:hypothetical protein
MPECCFGLSLVPMGLGVAAGLIWPRFFRPLASVSVSLIYHLVFIGMLVSL